MLDLQLFLLFIPVAALFTLAPGPDSIMLLGRALGQGRMAGVAAATGCALGILITSVLVAAGLSAVVAASETLFLALRAVGAVYLVWVGIQAIRRHGLIPLKGAAPLPLKRVFVSSLTVNLLNPKVAVFMLAFLPQYARPALGNLGMQIFLLGATYALITVVLMSLMGVGAARLRDFLQARPSVIKWLNIGAGAAFIASGLKVASMKHL
ncbi:LysE family translocator [Denitromonas halophila]|uniref:LysE family translocator n=1 Tax=Denitromonas halophila TaxID=1629404 RepID=A0A557QY69_9RHOO|nr:LysE family translocator [Denitromonas halophila]TVO57860.1 LysE family translocator [Denitromonas halophila]